VWRVILAVSAINLAPSGPPDSASFDNDVCAVDDDEYITAFNWTAVCVGSSLSALPLLLSKPREGVEGLQHLGPNGAHPTTRTQNYQLKLLHQAHTPHGIIPLKRSEWVPIFHSYTYQALLLLL